MSSPISVPLLDLTAQYSTLKDQLDAALLRVAASQRFILGPEVEMLERAMRQYLEVHAALGVSSGTDALLLALMALGVGQGDEVILPSFTFFATGGVVARLGARPVFVDVEPVGFNVDPQEIERAITPRTRAIIPVHLFGQSADMEAILAIAARHGIPVVEDAAQAIGARYRDGRRVGGIGAVGCYSFFPSKNLGAFGDGGLVVTNDPELYERMRIMRVHGGEPKYYHSVVGGNFRIDELQAAVLNVKLPHLDAWSAARRRNARLYVELFGSAGLAERPGITEFDAANCVLLPAELYASGAGDETHIYNQFTIRARRRDDLRQWLASRNVGSEIYYPVPLHRQECFADVATGTLPISDRLAAEVIALPIYPELTEQQIRHVVDTIAEFFRTQD